MREDNGWGMDYRLPSSRACKVVSVENGGIWTYLMTSRMMCPDEE